MLEQHRHYLCAQVMKRLSDQVNVFDFFPLGIVNAGCLPLYDEIPAELLELCEDVLWNRRSDATEKLLSYAEKHSGDATLILNNKDLLWRDWPVEERIKHSLVKVIIFYSSKLIWTLNLEQSVPSKSDFEVI